MWDEVAKAKSENRRELVLTGKTLKERLEENDGNIDEALFALTGINFLELNSSLGCLNKIPDALGNLKNLTNLVLCKNAITEIPGAALAKLDKLRVLDLSENKISEYPECAAGLENLSTLNLSFNCLQTMPSMEKCKSLAHVNLSNNELTELNFLCHSDLVRLADVELARNKIEMIPKAIKTLLALKKLDLTDNLLKTVPGELADCLKIKELILKGNPISDNRFKKLVSQKGTKPVMEYIRQHFPKEDQDDGAKGGKGKGKGKGGKKQGKKEAAQKAKEEEESQLCDILEVMHVSDHFRVISTDLVKDIRPYLVCCIVRNLNLSGSNLKKFIQLQTKLHETVCEKRNAATIATHDLSKISKKSDIVYTGKLPTELKIIPLGQGKMVDSQTLVNHLKNEAEAYRKEKKRNTVSGIHQYLKLLDGKEMYSCLEDGEGRIISFPPITNSEVTKISESTKDILIEVTSSTKLQVAKSVADSLLREMLLLDIGNKKKKESDDFYSSSEDEDESDDCKMTRNLTVEQVKVIDEEANLKVIYPAKTDLQFEGSNRIAVKRE